MPLLRIPRPSGLSKSSDTNTQCPSRSAGNFLVLRHNRRMSTSVKKSRRKLHAKPALLIPTAQVDSPRTALRRCLRAWQRVIDSDFAESYDDVSPSARVNAAHAWCEAMPMLDGPQGVRCYLACVAHGLLIGAIWPDICSMPHRSRKAPPP